MHIIYEIPFLPPFLQVGNFGHKLLEHMKLYQLVNANIYSGYKDM